MLLWLIREKERGGCSLRCVACVLLCLVSGAVTLDAVTLRCSPLVVGPYGGFARLWWFGSLCWFDPLCEYVNISEGHRA